MVAGETADVMTYHLSHFPTGIKMGDLRPIRDAELQSVGLSYKDFNPTLVAYSQADSKAYGKAGILYGVQLDTHTVVVCYNKDLLTKASVLGMNGKPNGVMGFDTFTARGIILPQFVNPIVVVIY
jgi:multiple sugar transport system substrate-binding protein